MRRALIDPELGVRVIASRALVYTDAGHPDDDRPPHVRAASAIAAYGDDLFVIQDDASFIARVEGDAVTSIALPRGAGGRRRFEAALGNKLDKLDLESCVIVDDELWAFGSGTLAVREHVVRMTFDGVVRIDNASTLYARLRDAIGNAVNIEGVARVDDELWFFHRGNTSTHDAPAIVRTDVTMARVLGVERFDLGAANDVALGFTDACSVGGVVVFLAAAEASANAIDDGATLATSIGVIDPNGVRIAPIGVGGKPEGIAARDVDHAWITVDTDDPEVPTTLHEVTLVGIKASK